MAPAKKTELLIGTSGWSYDGWRGSFYPEDIPKRCWLQYYASVFSSAEINGSFYRTPSLEAVRRWRDETPSDFTYAWKASKFITHWKRLTPKCRNSIALMKTRLKALGPKAAVVLFQLPPQFGKDEPRLRSFLKMLPNDYRYAFEFRDPAWYEDDVLRSLAERDVALCISDHHDAPAPFEVTAGHVYLRGTGRAENIAAAIRTRRSIAGRSTSRNGGGRGVTCLRPSDARKSRCAARRCA